MFPAIGEGEMVEVAPAGQVGRGDIVLAETKDGFESTGLCAH
jgi:SOS-response transcriptional repressor LexA